MTTLNCEFTKKLSLEERKVESQKILAKYPDRVPVIIVLEKNTKLPALESSKFLIPNDLTMGHFIYVLRTKIKLNSGDGIYIFVNGVLPTTSALMSNIYTKYKAEDGFLYFTVAQENTFGGMSMSLPSSSKKPKKNKKAKKTKKTKKSKKSKKE